MFCTNCGTKIEDNARFCGNCGFAINSNIQQPIINQPPVVEQPVYEQVPTEETFAEQPAFENNADDSADYEKTMVFVPKRKEQPVAEQPIAEQPVAEQPVNEYAQPEPSYVQEPVNAYAQPEQSYVQEPVNAYAQPEPSYVQEPVNAYAQPEQSYVQEPVNAYAQPEPSYVQEPVNEYSQPDPSYVQEPVNAYAQPEPSYVQEPVNAYAQPEPSYVQEPVNAYAQPEPSYVQEPVNAYAQPEPSYVQPPVNQYAQPTGGYNGQPYYGGQQTYNAAVNGNSAYGAWNQPNQNKGMNIYGTIAAVAVVILSILAFFNPYGGLMKYAMKSVEDVPGIFVSFVAPFVPFVLGSEMEIGMAFVAGIASVLAAALGFVVLVLLVIYIISNVYGKNKPMLGRVAMIICLVVTLLQTVSILGMNSQIHRKFMDGFDSSFHSSVFSDIDFDDDDFEDFLEDIGIDEDYAIGHPEEALDKLMSSIALPGVYNYILIVVSVAGIILVAFNKKKL